MVSRAGKKETGKNKTKPAAKKGAGRTRRVKQAEELTHIALEKYRILFESFPLGITITDAEGNIVEANRESERLLGIRRNEHLRRRYDGPEWKVVRPDGTPMPSDEYASVRALKENRRIENVEMGIVKDDDEITWINVTAEPIPLENFGVAITYSDIGARRKLQNDLEKQRLEFKHIIDSAPIIIFYKDLAGRMVRVNKTFSEALYRSESEMLGKTVFDIYSTPIAQAMTDDDQEVMKAGQPKLNIEEPYESATGVRWVRTDKVPIIDDNGITIGLVGFAQDITERKNSEEALRKSEEKYRTVLEQIEEAYYELDLAGNLTFFNDATCRQLGYSVEELLGMNYKAYISKEDVQRIYGIFNQVYRTKEPVTGFPVHEIRKDGTFIFTENSAIPSFNKNHEVIGFRGVARDITERKTAEMALKESEEKYRTLFDKAPMGIAITTIDGVVIEVNDSQAKMMGYTVAELRGKKAVDYYINPEKREIVREAIETEGKLRDFEVALRRKDNSILFEILNFDRLKIAGSDYLLITGKDVTDLRKAEKAKQESEAQYRLLAEHTTDTVGLMDKNLKVIYVSPSSERVRGFTAQEIMDMPLDKQVTPESLKLAADVLLRELPRVEAEPDYNPILQLELEYVRKDGSTVWLENKFSVIRDDRGNFVSILAEARDITDRRLAEETIRTLAEESQWLLKSMINAFVIFQSVFDNNGEFVSYRFEYINEAYEKITSVKLEDVRGKTVHEIWPETEPSWIENYGAVAVSGIPRTFNMYHKPTDKTYHCFVYRPWPTPERFCVIFEDISDLIKAEQAKQESEAQYHLLAEHTKDFVWLLDMDLNLKYQSPSADRLTGFTHEELMKLPFEKRIAPSSLKLASDVFFEEMQKIKDDPNYNPIRTIELEIYRKDGTTIWSENTLSVIRDENGKPISILGEAREITKRREAEKKLEQTLAALEKTLNDTVIAISKMVEMKDPFTAGHQMRVAQLASAMGEKMNLSDQQLAILNTAATIHDIGKIYVPSDILSKPGKLNPLEYEIIQTHVRGSYEILRDIDFAGPIAEIVFQHHERMDGSGYPRALKSEDILPEAKILIVADVVEAMSSHRAYRASMGIEKALEEISINRGKLYDEAAVDACLDIFNNDRFHFSPVESSRIV